MILDNEVFRDSVLFGPFPILAHLRLISMALFSAAALPLVAWLDVSGERRRDGDLLFGDISVGQRDPATGEFGRV